MNRTSAPYGDMLGLMNPLSKRSLNCSFNFLSSAGVILYNGMEISWVSKRRSIPKSISLSRGTLERSLGNASGNLHAVDSDSRVRVPKLGLGLGRYGRNIP
ncbi:hypothetical protein CQW23_16460 [Capsicum baccatum]|uniref:Uncharacterized protein n=1 Tax=Capsicum baccatum TaxID=33114 RepID=A0A2G2WB07_CAPBA|nr:hypothetical protein CQW23_16460 [Capsicum baccatum]